MCRREDPYANAANLYQQTAQTVSSRDAAKSLARLMKKQLNYAEGHIDSVSLALFIRAYWSRVSKLAHLIHEDQ